jgi:hypothetical protein
VLVDVAKKFLGRKDDKPFFLWIHFYEPHPPYFHRTQPKDYGTDLSDLYDGELRFVDEKFGELVRFIQELPGADRTVIAVSSDHGREFGEHGPASHGYDLYTKVLHVPLMFSVPGLPPRRIKNPVALLDLLPTFVALAQIKEPFDFEGESLIPQLVEGKEPPPDRPIFSWVQVGMQDSHIINSITTRDYKLIYDVSFNTYQLFDFHQDPEERRNVAGQKPVELARMKNLLQQVSERVTLPTLQEEIFSNILSKPPDIPGVLKVNFDNKVEFLGFELRPPQPRADEIITIYWYIKALKKLDKDYKVLVDLRGNRGSSFDAKHVPIMGTFPMSKWTPGQIVRDRQLVRLPPPAQEWDVWVGFGSGPDILKPLPPLKLNHVVLKVGKFSTN